MNRFSVLICGFLCRLHYSNRDVTSVPHWDLLAFVRQAWERALTFIMHLKPAHYRPYAWTVWEISVVVFLHQRWRLEFTRNYILSQRFLSQGPSQIARRSEENFWIGNKNLVKTMTSNMIERNPEFSSSLGSAKVFPIHFLHICETFD